MLQETISENSKDMKIMALEHFLKIVIRKLDYIFGLWVFF